MHDKYIIRCTYDGFLFTIGGYSVHYLMLIEEAKGLFHRAIPQSGHALSIGTNYSRPYLENVHKSILENMGQYIRLSALMT